MIDIMKAQSEFKNYVKPYDVANKKIALKIAHSYRVSEVSKKIAIKLGLKKEDIELATLIGLLHDIGRFEQLRIYDSFNDRETIDHGDLGVKILFEDGLIRNFIEDDKYDNIIYKSIKNHNKFKMEKGLNSEELLHTKIIRDADKTDILFIFVCDIEEGNNVLYDYNEISKQIISKPVMENFLEYKQTDRKDLKNEIEQYINIISFIYDYNFIEGLKIIKQNNYIEKIIDPICICKENLQQMNIIKDTANKYIEERIKREDN